jgi:uncharacterized protein YggU (UPF0235/DUF167 family)
MHNGMSGSALAIRIIPRARLNEIAEILSDGTIRIRLMTTSSEDKMNSALTEFLATVLDVPQSRIEIVAGLTGKDKLVSILDMDTDTAQQRILENLGGE